MNVSEIELRWVGRSGLGGDGKPWRIGTEVYGDRDILPRDVISRKLRVPNAELARKLESLEKKYDTQFRAVFDAIRKLMTPEPPKRREIGFHVKHEADNKPKARRRQP